MKTLEVPAMVDNGTAFKNRMALYYMLTSQIEDCKDENEELPVETNQEKEIICNHCGSVHTVKNGKRSDGTQRYLCRDCKKSFLLTTDSILSGTHKHVEVWKKYFECMMNKMTLKESAQICGISIGTAFFWRHKILDSLKTVDLCTCQNAYVEMYETYTDVAQNENHCNENDSVGLRDVEKDISSGHEKEIVNEKEGIVCTANQDGTLVDGAIKTGNITSGSFEDVFSVQISPKYILCPNKKECFNFSDIFHIKRIQMDSEKKTTGNYEEQQVSHYWERFKCFLSQFHGVACKYLDLYFVWHNILLCTLCERFKDGNRMFIYALMEKRRIRCADFSGRPVIPAGV